MKLASIFLLLIPLCSADHIDGVIKKIRNHEFVVDQNVGADPHSGYRRGSRQIVYQTDTIFEQSAAEDLRVGRSVDVIGDPVGRSRVRARRITVCEGHRPVRMPANTCIIPTTGPPAVCPPK